MRRHVVVGALAAALAACASFGGARPRWAPLPEAVVLASSAPLLTVFDGLRDSLVARGFTPAVDAPREGYLETRWYDLDAQRSVGDPFTGQDRVVRLRFFVDRHGTRTHVVAEVVRRIAWDPSRPARDLEAMVPEGMRGREILAAILSGVPADTVAAPVLPAREP